MKHSKFVNESVEFALSQFLICDHFLHENQKWRAKVKSLRMSMGIQQKIKMIFSHISFEGEAIGSSNKLHVR